MTSTKVISAAVVIFLAGAATGALAIHKSKSRALPSTEPSITQLMDKLDRELSLTPEQRAAIEKWLLGTQEHMQRLLQQIEPQAAAEKAQLRENILGELTKTQCDKFEQIFQIITDSSKSKPPGPGQETAPARPPETNQPSGKPSAMRGHPFKHEQPATPAASVDNHPLSAVLDTTTNPPVQSRD